MNPNGKATLDALKRIVFRPIEMPLWFLVTILLAAASARGDGWWEWVFRGTLALYLLATLAKEFLGQEGEGQ